MSKTAWGGQQSSEKELFCARIIELEAEVERLTWMLHEVWVQHFGLDTFEDWMADLTRRWEERRES